MFSVLVRRPVLAAGFFVIAAGFPGCEDCDLNPAPPGVVYIWLKPGEVQRGSTAQARVQLSSSAASGGTVVTLTSLDPAAATVPATVTVPGGNIEGVFDVTTLHGSSAQEVALRAELGSTSTQHTLYIRDIPEPTPPIRLEALSLDNDDIIGGDTVGGTVTMSRPARENDNRQVKISPKNHDGRALWDFVEVFVPLGAGTARFTLRTREVNEVVAELVTAQHAVFDNFQSTNILLIPRPLLSGISPSSALQGQAVDVTLTGRFRAFGQGAGLQISGTGVVPSNLVVTNDETASVRFTVAAGAPPGPRNVTLFTNNLETSPVTFTVLAAPPVLTSIAPATGVQGSTVDVTLAGTFLGGTTGVVVSGGDIGVSNIGSTATTATARFTIPLAATPGARQVSVTTPGGASGTVPFTVTAPPLPPAPVLTSISPASGDVGFNVAVTITGTNFTAGSTVAISGADVTVSGVTVVNSTTITATFGIGQFAAAGPRSVTVTNGAGTSNAVTFTVNP